MKVATYAKKYGGTTTEWEETIKTMNIPQKVVEHKGKYHCPVCGHTVRQFEKCSYCEQKLEK